MRSMPQAHGLREAVQLVISSNKSDGYPPARFIQATEEGYADDLLERCTKLIEKGETLEYLESAFLRFPSLLTLETSSHALESVGAFQQRRSPPRMIASPTSINSSAGRDIGRVPLRRPSIGLTRAALHVA